MTSPQRVNSATTLQRGKAREESTSLFGGVEQEKSRWKLTKYKIQEIQNTKNKIQNKRTNIDNQTRSKQKYNRATKRKASRYWANEESKKTRINNMKNEQIKTEKKIIKKSRGAEATSSCQLGPATHHLVLCDRAGQEPCWGDRRYISLWTYFFWQRDNYSFEGNLFALWTNEVAELFYGPPIILSSFFFWNEN